ncbi:MAG: PilZ domain-containing protein [Bryobacteraceae bacterium]
MPPPMSFGVDWKTRQRDHAWRSSGRFPVACDMCFRLANSEPAPIATGRTVNMSSRGLLFRTEGQLLVGQQLEIGIKWPSQLGHQGAGNLFARGTVVRARKGLAAVSIDKCGFRAAGQNGFAV